MLQVEAGSIKKIGA